MKYVFAVWLPMTFTIVCIALGTIFGFFYILAFFGIFDVKSRLMEMKKIDGRKFSKKLAYTFRVSNCQRNMVIAVWGKQAKQYYKDLGYKRYHVLPDTLLKNPKEFFSVSYITHTYFK